MELMTIVAAGVTLYCGWLTVMDDLGSWRRYRGAQVKAVAQGRGEKPSGYKCCLLLASGSRL
jgi:hypothetical protein